jgi:hypothetical protein
MDRRECQGGSAGHHVLREDGPDVPARIERLAFPRRARHQCTLGSRNGNVDIASIHVERISHTERDGHVPDNILAARTEQFGVSNGTLS